MVNSIPLSLTVAAEKWPIAGDFTISRGSKTEAAGIVESAEEKAVRRAEQIVADAHDKLQNDVAAAREALRHETIELVAAATEKVIGEKLDTKKDAQLIDQALATQTFGKKG